MATAMPLVSRPHDADVAAFLDALERIPWFTRVGEPIRDGSVEQAESWEEGYECLQDDSWLNTAFGGDGESDLAAWEAGYTRALQILAALPATRVFADGVSVAEAVAQDVAAAAAALARGRHDSFFVRLMDWYWQGHWPCGWYGRYPEGRLIVY